MKFDGSGIIGFHAGVLQTSPFKRLIDIKHTAAGYQVIFTRPNGQNDFWCITSNPATFIDDQSDFIEIDGILYEGDMLEAFCTAFITMAETKKAIDSL